MRAAALLLAMTAASSWGIGGILLKKGVDVVSPATILLVQYLLGVLIVGTWVIAGTGLGGALAAIERRWLLVLAVVACQLGGYIAFVSALRHAGPGSASTATVVALAATYPALVAFLSGPLLGERLGWQQGLGIALIVAGIAVTQIR